LYLWHFPLAMLLPAWAAFFGTFVLAALSYRFVELPIRRAAAKWRGGPDRAAATDQPVVADDRGVINAAAVGQATGAPTTNPAVVPPIARRDIDPA
jgi:peptidoglycan/LPS O-acetylase OafA/YrhL